MHAWLSTLLLGAALFASACAFGLGRLPARGVAVARVAGPGVPPEVVDAVRLEVARELGRRGLEGGPDRLDVRVLAAGLAPVDTAGGVEAWVCLAFRRDGAALVWRGEGRASRTAAGSPAERDALARVLLEEAAARAAREGVEVYVVAGRGGGRCPSIR